MSTYQWTISSVWHSADWFVRAAFALLAVMTLEIVRIGCHRAYRYVVAATQSRAFRRDTAAALRDGRFDEVASAAARHNLSPVAGIVATGIAAFSAVPSQFSDAQAIDAVEGSFQRGRKILVADLGQGIGSLKTIASVGPFVGLAGTCAGILYAFRGYVGERSEGIARIASDTSLALATTAAGLLVGLLAVWLHNYLWRRVEVLRSEVLQAEASTIEALKNHQHFPRREPTSLKTNWCLLVGESPSWEVPYDRQRTLLLGMWLGGLWILIMMLDRAC